ncbi:MAG: sugar phosphate nucleotidyltransferase [Patescibacteria group bacterium]
MKKINSLIIPVAGIGSRLQPLTHITTKELVRLVDKPIFYYLVQEAHLAGLAHIIFIIHKDKTGLKDFIESKEGRVLLQDFPGMKFSFVLTSERWGDGHAIIQAKKFLKNDEVFAVTMGDLISLPGTSILNELKTIYEKHAVPVISVENIPRIDCELYGVISPKKSKGRIHEIASIVEKPKAKDAPSTLAMKGKYILTPDIFPYLDRLMNERTTNEVRLSNALSAYAAEYPLYAYESKGEHYDTGTKYELVKTEAQFVAAHPEYGPSLRKHLKQNKAKK